MNQNFPSNHTPSGKNEIGESASSLYSFHEILPFEKPKLLSNYDKLPFRIKVNSEGNIIFFDLKGELLNQKEVLKRKGEYPFEITQLIQDISYEINSRSLSLETFHLLSPLPKEYKKYKIAPFEKKKPEEPYYENPSLITKIFFKKKIKKLEESHRNKSSVYEEDLKKWQEEKDLFFLKETKKENKMNNLLWNDPITMKEVLYENLKKINFPLPLAYEITFQKEGKIILFNLMIEDQSEIIKRKASFDKKEKKIKFKKYSSKEEKDSMEKNLSKLLFFFYSQIFHSLPNCSFIEAKACFENKTLLKGSLKREEWINIYNSHTLEDLNINIFIKESNL